MMMSKLFRPAKNLLSQAQPAMRIKELHEYLCLREALNPKESETVLKDLEATSKKLKITPNQATEIVYLLQNDPSQYSNYLGSGDLEQLESVFETEYQNSNSRVQNVDFNNYRSGLWSRYKDLLPFLKPGPERAAGLKTLEEIFLKDGPTGSRALDRSAIESAIPSIKRKVAEHVKKLQGQSAQVTQDHVASHKKSTLVAGRIGKALEHVVHLLEVNPTLTYGRIRGFVELSKGGALQETTERKAIGSGETSLQKGGAPDSHLNIYQRLAREPEADLPQLIEERNVITQRSLNFQMTAWKDDRLRIFQADLPKNKALLWNSVGVLASVDFLYTLIQQESTITTLLATGALAYYGLNCGIQLARQSFVDRLVSVDLHRDGKYVDLVIQGRSGHKNVTDLPIEKFKLHAQFKGIEVKGGNIKDLASLIGVKSEITPQDLQNSGLTDVGLFATYNENYVFIPQVHQANHSHIGNLFTGKQVTIADQSATPVLEQTAKPTA